MELANDVIIVVLSSVNNDLFVYVLATDVGCEITCVGFTEKKINMTQFIGNKKINNKFDIFEFIYSQQRFDYWRGLLI